MLSTSRDSVLSLGPAEFQPASAFGRYTHVFWTYPHGRWMLQYQAWPVLEVFLWTGRWLQKEQTWMWWHATWCVRNCDRRAGDSGIIFLVQHYGLALPCQCVSAVWKISSHALGENSGEVGKEQEEARLWEPKRRLDKWKAESFQSGERGCK